MTSIETSAASPSKAPKSNEPKKHQYVIYNRETYAEAKYVHAIVTASSEEKAFNYLLENWKEYLQRPDLEDLLGEVRHLVQGDRGGDLDGLERAVVEVGLELGERLHHVAVADEER